jgi:hypothetical protein
MLSFLHVCKKLAISHKKFTFFAKKYHFVCVIEKFVVPLQPLYVYTRTYARATHVYNSTKTPVYRANEITKQYEV